ncbi:DNA gyrase subunit A, partial [Candidatus Woesearchaeota archaeon]|nr:DNA gyrase subunit A [Candidatus Woesearchaeota archaeon]
MDEQNSDKNIEKKSENSPENVQQKAQEHIQNIIVRPIDQEMKGSYIDYAMSVIVGRALPDVRDGLKPVHRRILYAMNDLGIVHNKPFRLIDGQGNFGSVDGDNAASMRYTEARTKKIAEEMLEDLEKETVLFVDNFDGSLKEPSVLPSKVPNLLINGSSGIAVGMATNIPPHNITETCTAIIRILENPEISVQELLQIMHGPDFPTGGIICGRNGIAEYFATGRGKVLVRGKTHIEKKHEKESIIITEIPYMTNKALMIESLAEHIKNKVIEGISDIRDESDRDGMRAVIELKRDAISDVVLNNLYKHTNLQTTFGIILLALVNNEPKILPMKEVITEFIKHRKHVVVKRTEFDLRKAEERAHILEGLIIALNNIDKAVALIKASKSVELARQGLMNSFTLSEIQANAILEMKLQRLTSLEQDKIREEHKGLLTLIADLKDILAKEMRVIDIIINELRKLIEEYGDTRKTEISETDEQLEIEDLIPQESVAITITHAGYIKRLPVATYKSQRRGGKGIVATTTKDEDFVEDLFVANTHDYILFFTNTGKVHWLKVYRVPEASRIAKGKAI